jgi:hypothetical protein
VAVMVLFVIDLVVSCVSWPERNSTEVMEDETCYYYYYNIQIAGNVVVSPLVELQDGKWCTSTCTAGRRLWAPAKGYSHRHNVVLWTG